MAQTDSKTDTKEEIDGVAKLGDVIAEGESRRGGYNAYNTGTEKGRDGRQHVVYSGVKDLSKMTVDQILASHTLSPHDRDRVFAAGKYQVIYKTLADAKAKMPLNGDELFTPELQERIFLHYLLPTKRPKIGAYITRGTGSIEDAVYDAAKEWASIEVPAGRPIDKSHGGYLSNGHVSYYESPANHAKPGSGARIKAALEQARAAYAGTSRNDVAPTPEPIVDPSEEKQPPAQTQSETKPQKPTSKQPAKESEPESKPEQNENETKTEPKPKQHLIHASVGRGGRNHAHDVAVVQHALAQHGHSPGRIDHVVGPHTIAAIEAFQRGFLPHPDGLVEVGHATEKHLLHHAPPKKHEPASTAEKPTEPTTETKPSSETKPSTPTPEARTEANPDATPTTTTSIDDPSLRELMAKPRLTTDEIHTARTLIAKEPPAARAALYRELQGKVIYANQRDNQATDKSGNKIETGHGEMCNLTSLAMCLQYLGVPNPHPELQYEDALEKVRQDKKLPARTTQEGWSGVARALGVTAKILAGDGRHQRAWWENVVGGALGAGHSVMLSITGHIVRVQDVNERGVIVDDPYGRHVLLPGAGKKVTEYNAKNAAGNKGEDNLWTWDQVEPHSFHWIASFAR